MGWAIGVVFLFSPSQSPVCSHFARFIVEKGINFRPSPLLYGPPGVGRDVLVPLLLSYNPPSPSIHRITPFFQFNLPSAAPELKSLSSIFLSSSPHDIYFARRTLGPRGPLLLTLCHNFFPPSIGYLTGDKLSINRCGLPDFRGRALKSF